MWLPDRRFRPFAGVVVAGFLLLRPAAAPAQPPAPPAPPESPGMPAPPTPPPLPAEPDGAPAARALGERYTAEALSDAVLLRPRGESSAVRSIELTEDGEVLVNGKEFAADELTAFLGDDGRRLAELSELDFDELVAAFGLGDHGARVEVEEEKGAEGEEEVTVSVDVPGVPGGKIQIRQGHDDRVSIGHSIHLREGETANEVVCVGCSVEIDGETSGDVVAVGGGVRVRGKVGGNAIAVGGSLRVEDGAEIEGDGVAVGGSVHTEDGGRIGGQRSSVGLGWGDGWMPFGVFSDAGELVAAVFRAGVLALLAVLCLYLMRPALERVSRRVTSEPWRAVLAGLLVQLFFLPVLLIVVIVLAVSVIGIPLLALVPVAVLAFVIGSFLGFISVAREVGRWIEGRTGGRFSSVVLTVVVGILLIQSVSIVGRIFSLPGGWFAPIGFTIVAFGFFVKYVVWTIGMGAMTLVALGRDWRRPLPAGAESEPPMAQSSPSSPPPPPARADDSLSIVPPQPPPPAE